jgi:hypothetical protein
MLWKHSAPLRPWQTADNVHYSVLVLNGDGMAALRQLFPGGEANELNACLFSTSGVHGTYCTIEDVEAGEAFDVTFLVVQPRIVCVRYGVCKPETPEDFAFLKRLRASSLSAIATIGVPSDPSPPVEAASEAPSQPQASEREPDQDEPSADARDAE